MSFQVDLELAALRTRVEEAIAFGFDYGQIDGSHHKTWVIDQMLRILAADDYGRLVHAYEEPDGEDTYTWDTGIVS